MARDDVRLYWLRDDGKPYRTFAALAEALEGKGKSLRFAMNGGMYRNDFRPVGQYIENGRELAPANTISLGLCAHPLCHGGFLKPVPGQAFDMLTEQIRRLSETSTQALGWGLILSVAVALWSAKAGTQAVFAALNGAMSL